jgi:hypothetical protein
MIVDFRPVDVNPPRALVSKRGGDGEVQLEHCLD